MKRLFRVFVLSKSEQRAVVIVVLALVIGALVRYERRVDHLAVQAAPTATPIPSPNPSQVEDE